MEKEKKQLPVTICPLKKKSLKEKVIVSKTGECIRMEKRGRYTKPIYRKRREYPETDVKQAVKEAYEELISHECEGYYDSINRGTIKEIFKDKFGFELE